MQLSTLAALLAALVAPPVTSAAGSEGVGISHGPLAGDVTSDSVVLWARAAGEGRIHARIEGAPLFRREHSVPVDAGSDFTASLAFSGLRPDTDYGYEVWHSQGLLRGCRGEPIRGRFRTAPAPYVPAAVRFAFGGDVGGQNACRDAADGYPIFTAISAYRPDFFVGLGDMIYADGVCRDVGRWGNAQIPGDFEESASLAGYWAHWRYNREDPHFASLVRSVPYLAIWDDHEVVNDFGPAHDTRSTPPYDPGQPLMPMGLAAFLHYNPLRSATSSDPERLYRSIRWGQHLELFVLDTRQYRDPNSAPDAAAAGEPKTLLGSRQRAWLERALTASDATWKVIVSSVPMSVPTGAAAPYGRDGWANFDQDTGFEQELISILRFMREAGILHSVWITTDVHFAAVFRYTPFDDAFVVHEVISGPLNAGIYPKPDFDETLNPERLFFHAPASPEAVESWQEALRWFNFGALEIDAEGELGIRILGADGRELYREALAPATRPR